MATNSLAVNEPSLLGTADWRKVMMWIILERASAVSDLQQVRQ